ncbi:MAG: diheme cytochrome c-553 [Saprospiraceae bacterium]|nr:diheme cytochrome c-553 [Saprospiraceae bacterium]
MKRVLSYLGMIFLSIILWTNCTDTSNTKADASSTAKEAPDPLERGKYLVGIIGCGDCHTPKKMTDMGPVPDFDRLLMGFPAEAKLPAINKSEITPGKWVLFAGDLMAAVGPWGISYAANLTPHDSGIGTWSFEQFKRAMTEGKHKGLENGRPVLPPMPWQSYREMSDQDLEAIYTYLMSIKPIENVVPTVVAPGEI